MQRKIIKLLIALAVVSFVLGMIFWVFSIQAGWLRYNFGDVKIINFSVCSMNNEELGEVSYPITREMDIYACGYLTTTAPIEFGMYVYHELTKKPILVIDDYDVGQGYFHKQIHLPEGSPDGEYRIDVRFRRRIIATTGFEIIEP